jgi:hypothetical protein
MIKTLLILLIINLIIKGSYFFSGFTLSPWLEWTKSCERNCSEQFGYQTRKRDCLYCNKNLCKIQRNDSYCERIGEIQLDIRPCYNRMFTRVVFKIKFSVNSISYRMYW